MLKFFLSSHGKLASGFKNAAEVLMGKQDNLTVFDAYVDERSVEEVLKAYYETVEEGDTVVLLADIVGGSVANAMASYTLRKNTFLIAGLNLAILFELIVLDTVTEEKIEEIVEIGKNCIAYITFDEAEPSKDDSANFF